MESGLIVRTGRGEETRYRRIRRELRDGGEHLAAEHILIPIGETAGWEAAVIDHHRAVLTAIAAKLSMRTRTSTAADEVGGTTLTFDLWPGHPREREVRALLRSTRAELLRCGKRWRRTTAVARKQSYQVHYYCGQYVVEEEQDPA